MITPKIVTDNSHSHPKRSPISQFVWKKKKRKRKSLGSGGLKGIVRNPGWNSKCPFHLHKAGGPKSPLSLSLSFNTYLFVTYYLPGSILGTEGMSEQNRVRCLSSWGLHSREPGNSSGPAFSFLAQKDTEAGLFPLSSLLAITRTLPGQLS